MSFSRINKVILLVFSLVFFISETALATKDEYVDKAYNFKNAKRILVDFRFLEQPNGIIENEAFDIFFDKSKKVANKLEGQGYQFYNLSDIAHELKAQKNINLFAKDEDHQKDIREYIEQNMDSIVVCYVGQYGMGSRYKEGYYRAVPSTTTTTTVGSIGNTPIWKTTTTNDTIQEYVPARNAKTVYCSVKFEVTDVKTNKAVWTAIDSRYKELAEMGHSKPKGMYMRILDSFFKDYQKKLSK